MKIIRRKDSSPETRDLVRQRIALTKVARRPDEEERKEVKRIKLRLKRKEEHRVTNMGGGYFRNFGNQPSPEHQEHGRNTNGDQ